MSLLPPLPSSWESTRLDRVATVRARIGWKALTADEYVDDGYAFLSTPNIKGRNIDFDNVNCINEFRYSESPELVLQQGDVLLTKDGNTLGIANIVRELPRPATVNGSIALIRTTSMDPRFLLYVILSSPLQGHIQAVRDGMGVPHLFQRDINRFAIPAPPLDEQRRIADFLDDQVNLLDQAIALRQQQIDFARESQAARLDVLLRQGNRPGQELVPAEYQPFGLVPKAWRQGRLRSTRVEVQTGPFGSQLNADQYVDGGWPVVNPSNITRDGHLIADKEVAVDDVTRDRLARHVLRVGDVVFGRRGDLGRAGLVTGEQAGWICGTGSLRVRFLEAAFEPAYLTRFLRLPSVRFYFESNSVGSTMQNLNTSLLLGMPLLMPSAREQEDIAREADALADLQEVFVGLLLQSIGLLQERKQSLITAAVTGEFDVTTARKVDVA